LLAEREPVRIACLISGGGTNLQALLDAQASGALVSGHIALVISDREEAYGLVRAEKSGCKAFAIPRKLHTRDAFEDQLLHALQRERIELIVLAGFLQILSERVIQAYPGRIINVHPSLIPSFCGEGYYGLRVHEAALARGVKITGATVHIVNEIPDGGPILLQKAVDVFACDTPETLQRRVMEQAEWILLPQAAELVSSRLLKGEPTLVYPYTEEKHG
jgi:phosphoribosylglycinamide formyltransferase-1